MKSTTLLVICMLGMQAAYGQIQSGQTSKTLENGVVIVESKGVEAPQKTAFQPNPVRTVNDWSLPECEDALRNIQLKLDALHVEDESYESAVHYYQEERAKILQRKQTLTGH